MQNIFIICKYQHVSQPHWSINGKWNIYLTIVAWNIAYKNSDYKYKNYSGDGSAISIIIYMVYNYDAIYWYLMGAHMN